MEEELGLSLFLWEWLYECGKTVYSGSGGWVGELRWEGVFCGLEM